MTSNLESTSDLGSENNNGVQDDLSCIPRPSIVVPGLEESILFLSNTALHGVILNGFLVWADIQRRTTAFRAYGVVVSMFDLHRSDRGSNHSRGSKISCLQPHYRAAPLASV